MRLPKTEKGVKACIHPLLGRIAAATVKRPTVGAVQAAWGSIAEGWDEMPEETQALVMEAAVGRIVVLKKDRVRLQVATLPAIHDPKFEPESEMGALADPAANYADIVIADLPLPHRLTRWGQAAGA